ncbi:carbohydrate ABC transporter permease [Streptomyces sp. CT34]|uniref:carbohydrate ABC transporter permease n=1 Tax=Streptomyces sp. CT34 TaxID=1553907 RepID=UPI0005BC971F|nr:carbohydrate ABC transporter permease [Streptomyces sp. CT34]
MTVVIASARPRAPKAGQAGGQLAAGKFTYLVLAAVTLVSAAPLLWTVVAASTSNTKINQATPNLLPGPNLFHNFGRAFTDVNMGKALLDSVIVSTAVAAGTVMFGTLAGFAFAKLRFRGRNALLGLTIGTMMIPYQIGIVPLYLLMAKLHWAGDLKSVIVPTLVSAFGVFFLRQYLITALPDELIEAARIDGASNLRIFSSIVLATARPAMAVLGMLTFMSTWNDLFWPLIALGGSDHPTVQTEIAALSSGYVPDQSEIMAGTLLGILPVLFVFMVLGRQIVGGIMQGAVKG